MLWQITVLSVCTASLIAVGSRNGDGTIDVKSKVPDYANKTVNDFIVGMTGYTYSALSNQQSGSHSLAKKYNPETGIFTISGTNHAYLNLFITMNFTLYTVG